MILIRRDFYHLAFIYIHVSNLFNILGWWAIFLKIKISFLQIIMLTKQNVY